ncbi:MAG: DNA repair protein RadC [Bacteroidales bacterium]
MPTYRPLPIKEWALEDRPREKLVAKGIQSLSDAELIAILLSTGSRNRSALDLAKEVLNSARNNLNALGRKSLPDLQKINGIGQAKAISIIAALELGRRRKLSEVLQQERITSSQEVFEIFGAMLSDLAYEEFWVLFLDRANKIIDKFKFSQGGVSGTVTDVRLILKKGIELLASSMILCHNHPSGNLSPSEADNQITRKIKKGGALLDIQVLDHLIIGNNKYFSYADQGLLPSNS